MAADLARHGIQVNTLSPGYFATDMNRELVDDATFIVARGARPRDAGATSPSSTGAALSLLGRVVVRVGAESRRRRG
jgi:NAD(P)-dependent dehydrogenase (short-subunit alcohol dehydrogenase family)